MNEVICGKDKEIRFKMIIAEFCEVDNSTGQTFKELVATTRAIERKNEKPATWRWIHAYGL